MHTVYCQHIKYLASMDSMLVRRQKYAKYMLQFFKHQKKQKYQIPPQVEFSLNKQSPNHGDRERPITFKHQKNNIWLNL